MSAIPSIASCPKNYGLNESKINDVASCTGLKETFFNGREMERLHRIYAAPLPQVHQSNEAKESGQRLSNSLIANQGAAPVRQKREAAQQERKEGAKYHEGDGSSSFCLASIWSTAVDFLSSIIEKTIDFMFGLSTPASTAKQDHSFWEKEGPTPFGWMRRPTN
jgi:hypothetical protein